ncbi:MAG: hypothetical protein FD155_2585 [Bacteroidetes bacterium]|nr:MAG: hypothetical protein FD155_2585 [Bacteroidota bacterium]
MSHFEWSKTLNNSKVFQFTTMNLFDGNFFCIPLTTGIIVALELP